MQNGDLGQIAQDVTWRAPLDTLKIGGDLVNYLGSPITGAVHAIVAPADRQLGRYMYDAGLPVGKTREEAAQNADTVAGIIGSVGAMATGHPAVQEGLFPSLPSMVSTEPTVANPVARFAGRATGGFLVKPGDQVRADMVGALNKDGISMEDLRTAQATNPGASVRELAKGLALSPEGPQNLNRYVQRTVGQHQSAVDASQAAQAERQAGLLAPIRARAANLIDDTQSTAPKSREQLHTAMVQAATTGADTADALRAQVDMAQHAYNAVRPPNGWDFASRVAGPAGDAVDPATLPDDLRAAHAIGTREAVHDTVAAPGASNMQVLGDWASSPAFRGRMRTAFGDAGDDFVDALGDAVTKLDAASDIAIPFAERNPKGLGYQLLNLGRGLLPGGYPDPFVGGLAKQGLGWGLDAGYGAQVPTPGEADQAVRQVLKPADPADLVSRVAPPSPPLLPPGALPIAGTNSLAQTVTASAARTPPPLSQPAAAPPPPQAATTTPDPALQSSGVQWPPFTLP